MKAKEYYEKFQQLEKEKGFDEAIVDIILLFAREIGELSKKRKCKFASAYEAIYKEQRQKWIALNNFDKRIHIIYFDEAIKELFPETYKLLKELNILKY